MCVCVLLLDGRKSFVKSFIIRRAVCTRNERLPLGEHTEFVAVYTDVVCCYVCRRMYGYSLCSFHTLTKTKCEEKKEQKKKNRTHGNVKMFAVWLVFCCCYVEPPK